MGRTFKKLLTDDQLDRAPRTWDRRTAQNHQHRSQPCPGCGRGNTLTAKQTRQGEVCSRCADLSAPVAYR